MSDTKLQWYGVYKTDPKSVAGMIRSYIYSRLTKLRKSDMSVSLKYNASRKHYFAHFKFKDDDIEQQVRQLRINTNYNDGTQLSELIGRITDLQLVAETRGEIIIGQPMSNQHRKTKAVEDYINNVSETEDDTFVKAKQQKLKIYAVLELDEYTQKMEWHICALRDLKALDVVAYIDSPYENDTIGYCIVESTDTRKRTLTGTVITMPQSGAFEAFTKAGVITTQEEE